MKIRFVMRTFQISYPCVSFCAMHFSYSNRSRVFFFSFMFQRKSSSSRVIKKNLIMSDVCEFLRLTIDKMKFFCSLGRRTELIKIFSICHALNRGIFTYFVCDYFRLKGNFAGISFIQTKSWLRHECVIIVIVGPFNGSQFRHVLSSLFNGIVTNLGGKKMTNFTHNVGYIKMYIFKENL